MFDEARVARIANEDAEFLLAARFWSSAIRLDAGDASYLLRIRDGKVAEFAPLPAGGSAPCDVRISGARADWDELLQRAPRPFHQDLMSCVWRHGFKIEGDPLGFNPYYQALNRLIELMRSARQG